MENTKEEINKIVERLSLNYADISSMSEKDKDELIALLLNENKRLMTLAYKDHLTGLQNRRGLTRQLDYSIAKGESFAVVLGDIDGFKLINDLYGHAIGDKVLSEIGKVFRESIRENDVAVRFGGDEFQLILRNCDLYGAYCKVDFIREQIARKVSVNAGINETVTMSFGIALCDQQQTNYKDAISQADDALYQCKNNSKNTVSVFTRNIKL